jgi:hypothetical protein
MARYLPNPKVEADGLMKLRASGLRKHGYFSYSCAGNVRRQTMAGNTVAVAVISRPDEASVNVVYESADGKVGYDYKIELTRTACRFGGHRVWLRCPLASNNQACGRRVAVLYLLGDLFGCRTCHRLTYASRNVSGSIGLLERLIGVLGDADEAYASLKRYTYRGKPTRKARRLLGLMEHADRIELDLN